jgi:hypothetical protein
MKKNKFVLALHAAFVLALTFSCFSPLLAQKTQDEKDADQKISKEIWAWNDAAYSAINAPDKWKDESAVILAKTVKYEYNEAKRGGNYLIFSSKGKIYERIAMRKRIKLQDKAAVTNYSEFSFYDDNNSGYWKEKSVVQIGIRVTKPDGKMKEVPIDEAVIMEVKTKYLKAEKRKIAIADLEVGDVIDYFYNVMNTIEDEKGVTSHLFSPIYYVLQEEYPIVKQNLEIRVMNQCAVTFKSVNGAKDLKETILDDEEAVYSLTDADRDKMKESVWVYRYRVLPLVKFKAGYHRKDSERREIFASKAWGKKNKDARRQPGYDNDYIMDMMSKFEAEPEKEGMYYMLEPKKDTRKMSFVDIYEWLRHDAFMTGISYTETGNQIVPAKETLEAILIGGKRAKIGYSESELITILMKIVMTKGVDHDLLFIPNRNISSLSDIVLTDEVSYGLRIVDKGKETYIFPCSKNSNFAEIPEELQGTEAYAVRITDAHKDRKLEKITIPMMAHTDNTLVHNINVTINDTKVQLNRQTTVKGLLREDYNGVAVTLYDRIDADKLKFKPAKPPKLNQQKVKQEREDQNRQRQEALKKNIETEIDNIKVLSLDKFQLEQLGIWNNAAELKFSESYTVEGVVKKVGGNYAIEAGKLIGSQVALDKESIDERKTDIFFPFARSFSENITITIPEGYEVQGLDKFTMNVENETGGFVSSGKLEGNKIIISAYKYYKRNGEPLSNWSKVVAYAEAAYTFSQLKLLLKKK